MADNPGLFRHPAQFNIALDHIAGRPGGIHKHGRLRPAAQRFKPQSPGPGKHIKHPFSPDTGAKDVKHGFSDPV
jgi:hypothetical protein